LAIQIFSGLAPSRAAWGWTMDVPTNAGFTCEQGTTIGAAAGSTAANLTCTVVPDSGMSCDVSTIYLQCSDADGGPQNFVPVEGTCINSETVAAQNNETPDTLSWSQVPTCSTSGASTSSTMMGCAMDVPTACEQGAINAEAGPACEQGAIANTNALPEELAWALELQLLNDPECEQGNTTVVPDSGMSFDLNTDAMAWELAFNFFNDGEQGTTIGSTAGSASSSGTVVPASGSSCDVSSDASSSTGATGSTSSAMTGSAEAQDNEAFDTSSGRDLGPVEGRNKPGVTPCRAAPRQRRQVSGASGFGDPTMLWTVPESDGCDNMPAESN